MVLPVLSGRRHSSRIAGPAAAPTGRRYHHPDFDKLQLRGLEGGGKGGIAADPLPGKRRSSGRCAWG